MGVAGDLCVARRRRCPCIAFSLLLDLASQDPSANVTLSMKRDTDRTVQYACGARPAKRVPPRVAQRTQAGPFAARHEWLAKTWCEKCGLTGVRT